MQRLCEEISNRYVELTVCSNDFTLMSPYGGKPSLGPYNQERMDAIGKFSATERARSRWFKPTARSTWWFWHSSSARMSRSAV
jgi:hypothetical protein